MHIDSNEIRLHEHLTDSEILAYRARGIIVRVCGQELGCYVTILPADDERAHERNGASL